MHALNIRIFTRFKRIYIYILGRRTVGAQKFVRDLCALPVARALLTYCLFAWTSAIYQKLLIVSAVAAVVAVVSVAPVELYPNIVV